MSAIRRSLANFSFYEQKTIENKLEQMASKGWMVCKAGNLFWTYKKIQPQKLRFAVTYFPGASEFDPAPSEKQLDKEEYCAHDGWRLVLRWDAMQIFCTDREDAVPIETDPVPHVANIHRTMKKKLLTGQLVTIGMILWILFLQISELQRDPVAYLSNAYHLFTVPLWLLLLIGEVFHLWSYFHWQRKAKKAAEDGIFLPVRTNKWLSWVIVALAVLFLLLAYSNVNTHFLFILCFAGIIIVSSLLGRRLMGWMKKKGVSRQINLALSCVCIVLVTLIGVTGIIYAGINGLLPTNSGSQPVDTYEWNGHIFDIYDDSIPLVVEDMVDVTARWSKKAEQQESIFLACGEYRQDSLFTENIGNYDLNYKIVDVKIPALYDFIKESLINAHQDEVYDDFVFTDHFEPIEPNPWNAQEVYQFHWSDSILDTYLVCWESRIVEIQFFWEPTKEQIKIASQILSPK